MTNNLFLLLLSFACFSFEQVLCDPDLNPNQDHNLICLKCDCLYYNDNNHAVTVNCSGLEQVDFLFNATLYHPARIIEVMNVEFSDVRVIESPFPRSGFKKLDLKNNKIEIIMGGVFRYLENLTELDLGHNWIEVLDPEVFRGLYQAGEFYPLALKVLNLAYNDMHSLHQDLFEHVDQIEVLSLRNNPLKDLDYSTRVALGSLVHLKDLDLSGTGLIQLPINFMHPFRYLKRLDLSENQIERVPLALQQSRALETLSISSNPIETLEFPTVPTLKILIANFMPLLTEFDQNSTKNLINLEQLYLENGQLRHFNPIGLGSRIKMVSLRNNMLSKVESDQIPSELKSLDLAQNPIDCDCAWIGTIFDQIVGFKCKTPIALANATLQDYKRACLDPNRKATDGVLLILILVAFLVAVNFIVIVWYFCMKGRGSAPQRALALSSFVHPYYSRLEKI